MNITPHIVLDAANRKLVVAAGLGSSETLIRGWDLADPSKRLVIDLEGFQLEERDAWPTIISALQTHPEDGEVLAIGVDNLLYRTDSRDGSVKSIIEIGADPKGVAVSQARNQVYVARGLQGGVSVVDEDGIILGTMKGPPSLSIAVDDFADRIYVGETKQIGVYELSSLRRLHTVSDNNDVVPIIQADHKRGVLWAAKYSLLKYDLFTGRQLGQVRLSEQYSLMALDVEADRAYLMSDNMFIQNNSIGVFNLETEEIIDSIDISEALNGARITGIDFDPRQQLLYVWREGQIIHTVDVSQKKVIDTFDTGIDKGIGFNVMFDVERSKAYTTFGHVVDLATGSGGGSFTGGLGDPIGEQFALNQLANTISMTVAGGRGQQISQGLYMYLGPAGTEVSAPPAPSEVVAEAGDEEVVVSWPAVDDSTLVGYHVYRKDRVESDFSRITRLPLQETTFTDLDLTNEQTYTYQISSIGKGALESIVRSESVTATPEGGGNFRLLVLQKSVSVAREDSVSLPISVEPLEGFDQEVTLSIEAPEGVEVVFNPEKFVLPKIAEVKIQASTNAALGRFELTLQGEGGEILNTAELVVEVTAKVLEQSVLTLELDQEEVPLDIPLQINGRLFPGTKTQVQLDFQAERADTLITLTVDTDREGGYSTQFLAPFTDKWSVTASWAGNDNFEGAQSRAVEFRVTSGKTRITATSDLADDADLGWIATIKGRIYPSPGTVGVTLNVRRPDKTEEKIEGVLSSEEGFYGHDLRMDQQGLWELWTSWKGNDRLLGAASSVVTVPVGADVGRVLLVACGQDSPRDIFWPTSNYLANLAYTTFQKRRLLKEKVFYLNDRQDQDVDRDGFMEDVDGGATMTGMGDAWDWVKERVNADNPLYVYLVGKGTPMGLEVSEGEVLTATQLGGWLDEVESSTGTQSTLIVDAAHAGNFIRDLSSQGRKVIGSTGPGLAFYQAEGYLSFSQYFLTDLYQGKSLQEAFLHTHNILRNLPGGFRDQRPGLEAEGNVIANQPGDYLMTTDAFIGAPFELGDLSPQIKSSSLASVPGGAGKRVVTQTAPISEDGLGPRLKLARPVAEQGVEISARIDDAEGNLKVVRAMIIPPESDSLSSLTEYPEVELSDGDGDGTWTGVSHEFLEEGVYPVILYAIDGAGNAAEPLRTTVLVEPPPPLPTGDFNGDGLVDFADFFMFADAFGGDDPAYDLDQSGLVDFGDFFLFADAFGGPLGKLLELAEEMLVLPESYALAMPYPNPFNSEVVVKYTLPREGDVQVVVYNALGQVVRRLVEGHRRLGHHRVVWDGRDGDGRQLATGMYVVRMQAGEFVQGRKVVFAK